MKSGNPYEKMNEVQTPFQEEPLTIHEKENLHQLAKSYAKGQTKSPRKWPLAVVAAVLIGGFALSFSYGNGSVLAGMINLASDVRVSLAQSFGGATEGNQYATDVEKTVNVGGKEVTVKNLAFDGDTLFMNTVYEGQLDGKEATDIGLMGLKVNGKFVHLIGAGGGLSKVPEDENLILSNMRYHLDQAFPKEGPFELELIFARGDGLFPKTASLTLKTSTKEIMQETKAYPLNQSYPDGTVVKEFRFNALNPRFILTPGESDTIYELRGTDEKGRHVVFTESRGEKDFAELVFSPVTSEVSGEALYNEVQQLNLTLYKTKLPDKSGKIGNDYKPVGTLQVSIKA